MIYYKVGSLKKTDPNKFIHNIRHLVQDKNDDDIVVIKVVSVSNETNDLVPKLTYESIPTND